jgi:protein-L-isoaspartate O-methyltransferase
MTATQDIPSPAQASQPLSEAAAEGRRISSILESVEDRSVHSGELEHGVTDWTTYYHLSSRRSLFLRTVRHLIKGRALEIGAECGALTRFLAETSREVIALEPVPERAEAARLRCSGLAKVKILNTSDLGMTPAGPYDVILTSLADWTQLRSMLAPNGRLIVVAANQLRQAISSPGDWSNDLRGKGALGPRALERELKEAGFPHCEFGFLFPDYDAPSVVFSPEAFTTKLLDPLSFFDVRATRYPRPGFGAPNWEALREAGLLMDFAPGFLVVASLRKPTVRAFQGLAYLYSMNRTAAFAKESVIEMSGRKLYIRRRPLVPKPEPVEKAVCRSILQDEPWLAGEAYDRGLSKIMQDPGWSAGQIAAWAQPWVTFLRASATPRGERTILPENYLDCTPFNLIIENGRLAPFDLEYAAVDPLDLECVVFRGLWGALTRQSLCADPRPGTSVLVIHLVLAVMRFLGMDFPESRVAEFIDWEARLQNQVTGAATDRAAFVLREQPLSRRNPEKIRPEQFVCQLFWRGPEGGYQEQESTTTQGEIVIEARQRLRIPIPALPGDVEKLRWDMADRPGNLRVYNFELWDANNDVAWSAWDFPGSSAFQSPYETQVIEASGELPLSFVLTGADPSVELATDAEHIRRLAGGGMLVVDCAWLDES